MTDLAETYLRAADVIRTRDLYKGAFWGRPESSVGIEVSIDDCPVCAGGALSVAMYGKPWPFVTEDPELDGVMYPGFERAVAGFIASAGLADHPELTALGRLAVWNDADERTAADVIAAFETAAKAVA